MFNLYIKDFDMTKTMHLIGLMTYYIDKNVHVLQDY